MAGQPAHASATPAMLLWALLLCCSAAATSQQRAAMEPLFTVNSDDTATKPAPVKTMEHLFLSGDSMETGGWAASTANLVAKTHSPTRTGIMVVVPDRPWEYAIAGYNSVTKVNESDYRIYYDAIGPKGRFLCVAHPGEYVLIALASGSVRELFPFAADFGSPFLQRISPYEMLLVQPPPRSGERQLGLFLDLL